MTTTIEGRRERVPAPGPERRELLAGQGRAVGPQDFTPEEIEDMRAAEDAVMLAFHSGVVDGDELAAGGRTGGIAARLHRFLFRRLANRASALAVDLLWVSSSSAALLVSESYVFDKIRNTVTPSLLDALRASG